MSLVKTVVSVYVNECYLPFISNGHVSVETTEETIPIAILHDTNAA